MSKYAVVEVFDFQFYDGDNLIFETNAVRDYSIEYKNSISRILIYDALFDTDLFNKITSGDFENKEVKIIGKTYMRKPDDGFDYEIKLIISESKIESYRFSNEKESVLVILAPRKNKYGLQNISIESVGLWKDKDIKGE